MGQLQLYHNFNL